MFPSPPFFCLSPFIHLPTLSFLSLSPYPSTLLSLVPAVVRAGWLAECCCPGGGQREQRRSLIQPCRTQCRPRLRGTSPLFPLHRPLFLSLLILSASFCLSFLWGVCLRDLICFTFTMNPTVKIQLQNGTHFNTYMYQVGTQQHPYSFLC